MRKLNGMLALMLMACVASAAPRADRSEKGSPFTLKQASDTPVGGFEKMSMGERTIYVAPTTLLTGNDVVAAEVGPGRGGSALVLDISGGASSAVTSLSKKGNSQPVALFVEGRLHAVGTLDGISPDGDVARATIGGMTSAQAERLVKLVDTGLTPTSGTIVEVVPVAMSGDTYTVDVFVQGARNLRSYQVKLNVSGGTAGTLTRTDVVIDKNRADYVFGAEEVILAEDSAGGRAGAVLMDGSVDQAKAGYLGTYRFKASPDARGTFKITVVSGEETILGDSRNVDMTYAAGPSAEITIGQAPNPRAGR